MRHLCTANFDIWLVGVGILWLLNNIKLKTCFLEILVKSVVDHFIGDWVNLHFWHHTFLFQTNFISLFLLLSTICILQNCIQVSLHVLSLVTDAWIKLEILILLPQIILTSHLFFEDWMLIDSHGISEITLSSLPFDFNNSLGSRIDSWMMRFQVH